MATKGPKASSDDGATASLGAYSDALLLAALNRGDAAWTTGRSVVTFKPGATQDGVQELRPAG